MKTERRTRWTLTHLRFQAASPRAGLCCHRTPSTRRLLSGTETREAEQEQPGPSRYQAAGSCLGSRSRPACFAALAAVRPQPSHHRDTGSGLPGEGWRSWCGGPAGTDATRGSLCPHPGTRLRTGPREPVYSV